MSDTPSPATTRLPKLYTTKEVAEIFTVTTETVRNWIIAGKLRGTQMGSSQYRVTRGDLVAFAKQHYKVDL